MHVGLSTTSHTTILLRNRLVESVGQLLQWLVQTIPTIVRNRQQEVVLEGILPRLISLLHSHFKMVRFPSLGIITNLITTSDDYISVVCNGTNEKKAGGGEVYCEKHDRCFRKER